MGLEQALQEQTVGALRLLAPIKVREDVTVREAVGLMRKRRLGCVVIVDESDQPIGQFSERALIKLLAEGSDFLDDPVGKHMAGSWTKIGISEPLGNAVHAMEEHGVRFLIVVDDNGKVTGLTGQKGMMKFLAEYFPRSVKVQDLASNISMDQREGA